MYGDPESTQPSNEVSPLANKLFIGGLSFATTDEGLRELFAAAGGVESATVVTDRDTGRSRGFGFVEMARAEDADAAAKKFNGQVVDGRTLKVEVANSAGSGGAGGGGRAVGRGKEARGGGGMPGGGLLTSLWYGRRLVTLGLSQG